mgnify:CR=1 FL=1
MSVLLIISMTVGGFNITNNEVILQALINAILTNSRTITVLLAKSYDIRF